MPVHPCSDPRLLEVRIADYRCKGGLCRLRAYCLHDVGTVLTPAQESQLMWVWEFETFVCRLTAYLC